jgi:hypothetical protein
MSIGILIPVFNDWAALSRLLSDLDETAKAVETPLAVLVVDDGSTEARAAWPVGRLTRLDATTLLTLKANVGHQRAIATGLVELARNGHEAVIVMDGDGEDRPRDILTLIERHRAQPDHIIAARRRKRSESPVFQLFYWAYKLFFHLLTGERLGFGNFMLIPGPALERITHNVHTPNNLAAAALRSRIPVTAVPVDRGERYTGTSKMRFSRLVAHGLTAIAVYAEQVAARILIAGFSLMALCALAVVAIVAIKLFTPWAVPGWATYTVVGLFIIFLQTAILCLMVTLHQPGAQADGRALHAALVKDITTMD